MPIKRIKEKVIHISQGLSSTPQDLISLVGGIVLAGYGIFLLLDVAVGILSLGFGLYLIWQYLSKND